MKIILTQEVSGLGTPGDIVEVKNGYGRNYLLPQGFAIQWTKGAEKQVAVIRRAREAREIRDLGQANEVKGQLSGLKVTLSARSGTGGRLFGGQRRRGLRCGGRRDVVRSHPVLAVGDLIRPRLGADERIHPDRREVELAVLHDRCQVLRAQLG